MNAHRTAALAVAQLAAAGPARGQHATWDTRDECYLDTGDECRLYVTEYGVGDTLVVLHGGWGVEHSYLLGAFAGLER